MIVMKEHTVNVKVLLGDEVLHCLKILFRLSFNSSSKLSFIVSYLMMMIMIINSRFTFSLFIIDMRL